MKTILTCPYCSAKQDEEIPTSSCVPFYTCNSCGRLVKMKDGHCCVFCSYGDRVCPLKEK